MPHNRIAVYCHTQRLFAGFSFKMNWRTSSTSRGVFATPGSRSFSKTPSLGSGIQKTPMNSGHSNVNVIDINSQSVNCVQNDVQRGKSDARFEMDIENQIQRTPRNEFNVNKRPLMNSQGFASKRRSVIYTTPDEGNQPHNSSFTLTSSSQSISGLLIFDLLHLSNCNIRKLSMNYFAP